MSLPRADPSREWKKSKVKTEDLLALLNSGFIREKEVDMWRAAAGDPYPMEKAEDEIPMFACFVERGLALPASDFFKGLLGYYGVEYLNLNPNGIFHTAVFVHFCEAFLGIKPQWILFRKFFQVKPQPSASDPRVVGGAGIQMREDATEQYLAYKLIDSNTDWKVRWFYITNHHPGLPKLVKLVSDEDVGLGTTDELLSRVLVGGNLLLAEVVDEGLPPVHVDHHDLLSSWWVSWDSGRWRRLRDRWRVKLMNEDARWYLSAGGSKLREDIRYNVVVADDVVELETIELVLELADF
jgi:hypothetical protein